MNRRQRNKNRANARDLAQKKRQLDLSKHVCENCGKPGGHWVQVRGQSLAGMIEGVDDSIGFYSCASGRLA